MGATTVTKRQRNTIYLMLIGCFIGSLNQTILSPALPSIMQDLNITAGTGQWLTTIFLLINGIMVPCTAYLMARFSTRQLYLFSMTLFGVGTLMAGLSHSFALLLSARILQAMAFGVLMPLLSATILMTYPVSQRGKAMGWFSLVLSIGPAIGPSVAGFIIDNYSWNNVFLLLVPFIFVDVFVCAFLLEKSNTRSQAELDKPSVILSSLGFGGLLYGFSAVGTHGWISFHTLPPLFLGSIIIYFFVKRQSRLSSPLLRFDAFKSSRFTIGLIISMLINAALLVGSILSPIYLQEVHGYTVLETALIMLPSAIIGAIMSPGVGILYDRFGGRALILVGLGILIAGSYAYVTLGITTSTAFIVFAITLRVVGIHLAMLPINTWSMTDFTGEDVPHANAVSTTLRQIAGSVGTAIFVSVYMFVQNTCDRTPLAASLLGLRVSFGFSATVMLGALILAFFTVEKRA